MAPMGTSSPRDAAPQPDPTELERLRAIYRRRLLTCVGTVIAVVPVIIVVGVRFEPESEPEDSTWFGLADLLTLVLAVVASAFCAWTWRCPACERLWLVDLYPRACRHCRVRFRP